MKKIKNENVVNLIKVFVIIALASALAFAFQCYKFNAENVLMVYIVAVIIVILETKKTLYGTIATLLSALIYDFYFVMPRFHFYMENYTYLLSIAIFLAVCSVGIILNVALQTQNANIKKDEIMLSSMYGISKRLLNCKSPENVAETEAKHLKEFLNRKVEIGLRKRKGFVLYGDKFFSIENDEEVVDYAVTYNIICGYNQNKFSNLKYKIYPLKAKKFIYGFLVVDCRQGDLSQVQKDYIMANIAHILITLEREKISDKKENIENKVENAKLKSSIIADMSEDIEEPVNKIEEKISNLINNFDSLSDESVTIQLYEIKKQSETLNEIVNNIKQISKSSNNKDLSDNDVK